MKEKEIDNRNEAISIFRGKKKDKLGRWYTNETDGGHSRFLTRELKYNSDWNWLMLVIEQINNTFDDKNCYTVHISDTGAEIHNDRGKGFFTTSHSYFDVTIPLKEAVFIVVSDFCIDWVKDHPNLTD